MKTKNTEEKCYRWVATKYVHDPHIGPLRTMCLAQQGRNTYSTEAECQNWIDGIKNCESNTIHDIQLVLGKDFRKAKPMLVECYPGHFDPMGIYFDAELPEQPIKDQKHMGGDGHTPGPWLVNPCSNGGLILVRGEYQNQILPCEDAVLMCAAPDMLEALRDAATMLEDAKRYFPKSIMKRDTFRLHNVLANSVNPAIAKAKGE